MSWHRRHNKDTRNYDKREAYLILRIIEAQRATMNNIGRNNPIERDLLDAMQSLETKARAQWSR